MKSSYEFGLGAPPRQAIDSMTALKDRAELTTRSGSDAAVLVVDDNRDSVESVAMLLELSGRTVIRAYSASEALNLLDEVRSIRLVLSDVKMPKLDGYDFFRVVAHRYPKLPVVLMTGYPILDDDDPPPHADVLTKPFDAVLLERITSRYLSPAES